MKNFIVISRYSDGSGRSYEYYKNVFSAIFRLCNLWFHKKQNKCSMIYLNIE